MLLLSCGICVEETLAGAEPGGWSREMHAHLDNAKPQQLKSVCDGCMTAPAQRSQRLAQCTFRTAPAVTHIAHIRTPNSAPARLRPSSHGSHPYIQAGCVILYQHFQQRALTRSHRCRARRRPLQLQ